MAEPTKVSKLRCPYCGKRQWGVFLPGFTGKPALCRRRGREIDKVRGLVATVSRRQAKYLKKPVQGVLPACRLLNRAILAFFVVGVVCALIAGFTIKAVTPATKEEAVEETVTAVHMTPYVFGMIGTGLFLGMLFLYPVALALLIPSFFTREPPRDRWRNVAFTAANLVTIAVMLVFITWSGSGRSLISALRVVVYKYFG